VMEGAITKDEALANADSATNLLWLLNHGMEAPPPVEEEELKSPTDASFTEFTLNS
jgi:twitching motility protein PilU